MDYVKAESRGRAAAIQNLGNLIGEMFAMTVLFGISKNPNVTQERAFLYSAIIVFFLALVILFIVRDPVLKENKKNRQDAGAGTEAEMETITMANTTIED